MNKTAPTAEPFEYEARDEFGDPELDGPALNTDREIWRERPGDFYADSIHVTAQGTIGIDCGGMVYTLPVRDWHRLATEAARSPAPAPAEGVTDAMVERASRAMCQAAGFDPNELMSNDGPRWRYYADGARAAITITLPAILPSAARAGGVADEIVVERACEIAAGHLEADMDGDEPFVRNDSIETAMRAVLSALLPSESAEKAGVVGWLFLNPDSGYEFSPNHPVESGECEDAENIRPATAKALLDELLSAWDAAHEFEGQLDQIARESASQRKALIDAEDALASIAGERTPKKFPQTSYEIAAKVLPAVRAVLPASPSPATGEA